MVTFGIARALLRRLALRGAAILFDAPLEFGAEVANEALHRPGGTVGQGADRMALDLLRDVVEHVDLGDRGISGDHPLHDTPYPAETLAARRALAAALMLIELRQPRDRPHDVGRFIHDDQCGGAEPALHRDEA